MHQIPAPSGKFRKFRIAFDTESLEVASLRECEYELVDPDFDDCHASATHIIRELGVVVCGPHSESARALHAEAVAQRMQEEAEFESRMRERMFEAQKEQQDETKSTQAHQPPAGIAEPPAGTPPAAAL